MTPAERLFRSFDRVYVLNLPDRADRRAEMAGELARIGTGYGDPRVRLFPAIRPDDPGGFPSIGARGCFLSHLAMLREARDEGLGRILILEDDCDFARGFEAGLPAVLDRLDASSWDIFYGGYELSSSPGRGGGPAKPVEVGSLRWSPEVARASFPLPHPADGPPPRPGEERLLRAGPDLVIRTTHCIGFGRAAIEGLVPYLEAMLDRAPRSAEGGPMHVDGAYGWFRASRPDLVCWLAAPRLAHQRPSRTDIAPPGPLDRLPAPLRRPLRALRRALIRRLA
ncbi:glycosyltransferase family 25 protein [Rhizorhabdus dicambivorans]|uniref:LPS biosynthesis glycosyltransferase n=1 Tax=Rhizorhabdus dicambivorans TaxID=1850238 RepID=A0A2A4G0S5_9SPHN|nr:glycosyltransferase family 25 protein [Rhizorhabdus dicambivorans]ATE63375.1 LPS biosynthesis glycosyltransferase [Rhizorhabdus dicambivorans]PCE43591.1 LPS biosynthesis glycosyltransferase [Rhizorhabdus dicambivorans]